MPAFTRPTIDGKTFESAAQQRGRPLLIVYWAAWCNPCRKEAPLLRRIKALYGDRLLMAGIAAGEGEELEDVKSAAKNWQLNYPVIYDKDESLKIIFNVQMIPQLILIDGEQRLVIRTMDLHALQAQLDVLLPPVHIEPTKTATAVDCKPECA
jgi:thiol-disulfide isomerase/thioredoxin